MLHYVQQFADFNEGGHFNLIHPVYETILQRQIDVCAQTCCIVVLRIYKIETVLASMPMEQVCG